MKWPPSADWQPINVLEAK